MFRKTEAVIEECSLCREPVAISYECPGCKLRICIICAIENHWNCPKCKGELM